MTVHNHGIDPSCRETLVAGQLRGECMRDLRDRIAIIQQAHVFCITECSCGHRFPWEKSAEWRERAEWHWAQHVADAVLEALALKREHLSGRDSLYVIAGDPRPIHRYVTEWEKDE